MKTLGFRSRLALLAGRGAARASRLAGRGSGGMIGGRVAQKLDPQILSRLAAGKHCVIVTGTNGKSTTTRMITAALEASEAPQGFPVASNRGGDNMDGGVISTFMASPRARFAVLEVDEMHVPAIARQVRPQVLVYLNLSRDQLDRVGEITKIEGRLRRAVDENPQATVVANCDDPLVTSAAWDGAHPLWVGAGISWTADSSSSPRSGGVIIRSATADNPGTEPGGQFWADQSDASFVRPRAQWYLDPQSGEVVGPGFRQNLALRLPGRANRGNAAQALAAVSALAAANPGADIQLPAALQAISAVKQVAGRYRTVDLDGRLARLLLAKNPAGWQESLSMVNPGRVATVIAVNGQIPDGVDLSWLWDVDFSALKKAGEDPHSAPTLFASGQRGRDLQVRLEYAGLPCRFVADPLQAVAQCPVGQVDLLANYTAFRDILVQLRKNNALAPTPASGPAANQGKGEN